MLSHEHDSSHKKAEPLSPLWWHNWWRATEVCLFCALAYNLTQMTNAQWATWVEDNEKGVGMLYNYSLRSGDNAVGSVCLSVRLSTGLSVRLHSHG